MGGSSAILRAGGTREDMALPRTEPKSWKCHSLAGAVIMDGHDCSQSCAPPSPPLTL